MVVALRLILRFQLIHTGAEKDRGKSRLYHLVRKDLTNVVEDII